VLQPKTLPVGYEYVASDGIEGSRSARTRRRHPRRLYTEGGWVKAGQTMSSSVRPLEAQLRPRSRSRARPCAGDASRAARATEAPLPSAGGQQKADDAASNLDPREQRKSAAARRVKSTSAIHASMRNHRLSSRANKSEGSLVTANETLLTLIWQVDPI
jgi:hypothetical protein